MRVILISSLILVSSAFAQPIAGGWGKADVKDPQMLEAARFAVAVQQSRSDSVFKLLAITRLPMAFDSSGKTRTNRCPA